MPRGRPLEADLQQRAESARAWYAANGRPFAAAARASVSEVAGESVRLAGGIELRSAALAEGLRATRGHAVIALAVSAGREAAEEVARLWASEQPDAAFFLDRFAAAATETFRRAPIARHREIKVEARCARR